MDKIIIGNFEVAEYNGNFSLIAVREYNGQHFQQWGRLELGKEKKLSDKSQPFKVLLGSKEEAERVLLETLKSITGYDYKRQEEDNGVPF